MRHPLLQGDYALLDYFLSPLFTTMAASCSSLWSLQGSVLERLGGGIKKAKAKIKEVESIPIFDRAPRLKPRRFSVLDLGNLAWASADRCLVVRFIDPQTIQASGHDHHWVPGILDIEIEGLWQRIWSNIHFIRRCGVGITSP